MPSDCCTTQPPARQTPRQFLEGKVARFKMFLEPYCGPADREMLEAYGDVDKLVELFSPLVPIVLAGQESTLVELFCAKLSGPPMDERARAKLSAYMIMFADVLAQ